MMPGFFESIAYAPLAVFVGTIKTARYIMRHPRIAFTTVLYYTHQLVNSQKVDAIASTLPVIHQYAKNEFYTALKFDDPVLLEAAIKYHPEFLSSPVSERIEMLPLFYAATHHKPKLIKFFEKRGEQYGVDIFQGNPYVGYDAESPNIEQADILTHMCLVGDVEMLEQAVEFKFHEKQKNKAALSCIKVAKREKQIGILKKAKELGLTDQLDGVCGNNDTCPKRLDSVFYTMLSAVIDNLSFVLIECPLIYTKQNKRLEPYRLVGLVLNALFLIGYVLQYDNKQWEDLIGCLNYIAYFDLAVFSIEKIMQYLQRREEKQVIPQVRRVWLKRDSVGAGENVVVPRPETQEEKERREAYRKQMEAEEKLEQIRAYEKEAKGKLTRPRHSAGKSAPTIASEIRGSQLFRAADAKQTQKEKREAERKRQAKYKEKERERAAKQKANAASSSSSAASAHVSQSMFSANDSSNQQNQVAQAQVSSGEFIPGESYSIWSFLNR